MYNPAPNATTVNSCVEMMECNSCSVQPTKSPDALYVLGMQLIT